MFMKLTSHNARVDVSGRHNDRNFDTTLAPHIDTERSGQNRYYTWDNSEEVPLNEVELRYYKEHFSKAIEDQNKRNRATGHPERNRTVKQYFRGQHTRPEDKIMQIGDKNMSVDPDILWECAIEYQKRFNDLFGSNCKILDISMHLDEETPHLHVRRVWFYQDEKGMERVGQSKALEQLGVSISDETKAAGRFNNAKITFTNQDRALFRDICKEKGIELEDDMPAKRKHLSVSEYKAYAAELEDLERERASLQKDVEGLKEKKEEVEILCETIDDFLSCPMFHHIHDEELEEARKKKTAQRAAELVKMFAREAAIAAESEGSFRAMADAAYMESKENKVQKELKTLNHKVEILSQFIVDKGLGQEFASYATSSRERDNDSPHKTLL